MKKKFEDIFNEVGEKYHEAGIDSDYADYIILNLIEMIAVDTIDEELKKKIDELVSVEKARINLKEFEVKE